MGLHRGQRNDIHHKYEKKMKKFYSLILILLGVATAFAQSAVVPAGGDAQSSSGSVSYTVGQIAVQASANSDGSVSVAEGVQQPYEIQAVGVDNYPQIALDAVVYPNPTENMAQLQLNGFEIPADGLRAILYADPADSRRCECVQ